MVDARTPSIRRRLTLDRDPAVWLLGGAGSLALGFVASRGGRLAEAALAAAMVLGVSTLVLRLGWRSLAIWLVLCGPLFPFARYPSQHSIATFDRVWIGAILVALIVSARACTTRRPTRWMAGAMLWMVVASGIRAVATPSATAHLSIITTWLDAFVLPYLLFLAARRAACSPERLISVAKALTAAGAILALIGIAEFILRFELATYSGGTIVAELGGAAVRSTGPFSYPEMQATALLDLPRRNAFSAPTARSAFALAWIRRADPRARRNRADPLPNCVDSRFGRRRGWSGPAPPQGAPTCSYGPAHSRVHCRRSRAA